MLAFTSVYFLESRLFNGLRPFGVKIFAPVLRKPVLVAIAPASRLARRLVGPVAEFSSLEFLIAVMIVQVSLLCKKWVDVFWNYRMFRCSFICTA